MQATQNKKTNQNSLLEKMFKLSEHDTNVKTELIAGITTFMTMAYILAVNSNMLSQAGMDAGAVFVATALSAALSTLVMAFLSNYPIALAPGMGLNAFFAYTVVLQMGYTWQMALLGVFIEGILFIILTITNLREQIINCIPNVLKNAVTAGVGLFIAAIGMSNAGLISMQTGTLSLGSMHDPLVVLTVAGLVIAAILVCRNIKGALLISILLTSAIGMVTGIVALPTQVFSLNIPSLKPTFMQAFSVPMNQIFSLDMVIVVFTFLFMDLFDTVGFLVGIASKGNLIDEEGKIPKAKQAMLADAIGTTVGAMLGTSTVTCYMESSAGISEGGKTGLTAFTVAILFILSLFLAPLFIAIPSQATGAALIVVGVMMAGCFKEIDFEDYTNAIPAFLTFILMPLTNSVADGIIFGVVSYTLLKLVTNKKEEVNISLIVLTIIFICRFVFLK
ncbi:NCS2 family permease [Intestinibacter sp.]|uniref:NCS2 family permease n=1 Tax=Intestinibacter sp. TaxID=1965304 RepID=UPI002A751A23|nr:NCS2 family permease [Intestinibacter sp.]MDY2738079.1 NCS2 family permease [Intestinibacter sp.]